MPIDINRFKNEDQQSWDVPDDTERAITFLTENDGCAWTKSEIAEQADIDPTLIGWTLHDLRERGLVRQKGRYWAIVDNSE